MVTANNEIDILIKTFFDNKGIKDSMSWVENLVADANKAAASMKKLTDANLKVVDTGKGGFRFFDTLKKQFISNSAAVDKLNKSTTKTVDTFQKKFPFAYLSVLFFGMQIQRLFTSIATSTVNTFMKMTEGVTPAAQAVTALSVSWELLKFSIGEAIASVLELLLPILLPIITAITDWIQQHQKLVGWIIIGGIVLGLFLMIVGSLVVGLHGVISAIIGLAGSPFVAWIIEVVAAWGGLLVVLGWIILIIAALYVIWTSNLGGIQEFTVGFFGILWELIKTVMTGIWEIIKTVLDIIVAIFKGDWQMVWELTKKLGAQLFALLIKIFFGILMLVYDVLMLAYNIIKDLLMSILKLFVFLGARWIEVWIDIGQKIFEVFSKPFKSIIDLINDVIDGLADIPGMSRISDWKISPKVIDNAEKFFDVARNGVTTLEDLANAKIDSLDEKLTAGFFTGENFTAMSEWVDKNNQFMNQINDTNANMDVPKANQQPDALAQIASITANLDALKSKAELANQTSQNVTQQNTTEAASWEEKNRQIQENINLLERQRQAAASFQTTGNLDMSIDVPNFATKNI